MIKGAVLKTEREYRAVAEDSSSSLKDFALDRKKYYKKHILKEVIEEEDSKAVIIGNLVDFFLSGEDEGDLGRKFHVSTCVSPPTGNMLKFTEELYKQTMISTNDQGEITRPFETLLQDAYNNVKYDRDGNWVAFKRANVDSYQAVVEKFVGSDAERYYNELRQVRGRGLSLVTLSDIENAKKVVQAMRENEFVGPIVNAVTTKEVSIYNQFQIEGVKLGDFEYKMMLDRLEVDHVEKFIQPDDFKCTWNVEGFYQDYYLKRLSYIQGFLYWWGLEFSKRELGWEGYEVRRPRFIVCDSINYYAPLIYQMSDEDLFDAKDGFTYRDRKYPGVTETITNLLWAKENNIWNISREAYQSKGIVKLKK